MAKNVRLIDMLHKEISRLDDNQRSAFREALKTELPRVIRKAGRAAKKAAAQQEKIEK